MQFALGLVLGLAFVPEFISGATTGRFALLALALPLLWPKPRFTVGHLLCLCWLAYAAVSLTWTVDLWNGVQHLAYLGFFFLAFCLGAESPSLQAFARGAALAMGINGALALAQLWGWHGIWEGPVPGALFFNKNFLAEASALTALLCAVNRDWAWALLCLPGILLTHCREVELALALATVLWCLQSREYVVALGLCAVLAVGALWTSAHTLDIRWIMWSATVEHLSPLGHGLGSFYVWYPAIGPLADGRPEYPHNELVYVLFELGIGSAFPVALSIWCWLGEARLRPLLLACCVMGALDYPLQLPFTLCTMGLLAGHCAYSRRSLRTIYAKWGDHVLLRA